MKIPANYLPVMPYLIMANPRAFLDFSKVVFGATEQMIVPDDKNQIMHAEIRIHDAVIMFAQATEIWQEKTAGMFIYVESVDKVFETAVENGAIPLQKPEQKEYGYSGGFEDPFGNQWWIVNG